MSGHIIAEHHDDVGPKRVGAFDDRLDVLERHPGIAGMNVGEDRDVELEARGPLRRVERVTRDAKPQHRLAEAIGGRRHAESAKPGQKLKEAAA